MTVELTAKKVETVRAHHSAGRKMNDYSEDSDDGNGQKCSRPRRRPTTRWLHDIADCTLPEAVRVRLVTDRD